MVWTHLGFCTTVDVMTFRGTKTSGPAASVPVRGGFFLDNDSPHNFARLGDSFLQAAKYTNQGFQNRFEWPTFFLAFQSLEHHLKGYLLRHGKTLEYVHRQIGHNLRRALTEAKAAGLALKIDPRLETLVMDVGDSYHSKDFQYRSIGEWEIMLPDVLIKFVELVRSASGN